MKISITRLNGKPVDPDHVALFGEHFSKAFDDLTVNGRPTDEPGWQALNNELDKVEDHLKELYPLEKTLSVTYLKDMDKIIEKYGPVSVYIDEHGMKLSILNDF